MFGWSFELYTLSVQVLKEGVGDVLLGILPIDLSIVKVVDLNLLVEDFFHSFLIIFFCVFFLLIQLDGLLSQLFLVHSNSHLLFLDLCLFLSHQIAIDVIDIVVTFSFGWRLVDIGSIV
jgi:hypothetical protein